MCAVLGIRLQAHLGVNHHVLVVRGAKLKQTFSSGGDGGGVLGVKIVTWLILPLIRRILASQDHLNRRDGSELELLIPVTPQRVLVCRQNLMLTSTWDMGCRERPRYCWQPQRQEGLDYSPAGCRLAWHGIFPFHGVLVPVKHLSRNRLVPGPYPGQQGGMVYQQGNGQVEPMWL